MWMNQEISLYSQQTDTVGMVTTIRDVIFSKFAKNMSEISDIRNFDADHPGYKSKVAKAKRRLQLWAPSAYMHSRASGNLQIVKQTNVMQLDFDHTDISEYEIEVLKKCIFHLEFIAFCSLSCSGKGVYALALISEPERLRNYAEHCFQVFNDYGIKADTTKGRNPQDLRYVSYDANMLIRSDPKPLHITNFRKQGNFKMYTPYSVFSSDTGNRNSLLNRELSKIHFAQVGHRWETVQRVAFTIGGLGIKDYLNDIKQAIITNPVFAGAEKKYCKCADDCFADGIKQPFQKV